MSVQILYFASLKEALKCPGESIELPAGVSSIGEMRVALNQEMVKMDAQLKDGDELAFFPPVTGG